MKVKVTRDFRDKTADMKLRTIGDVLDVAPERAKELLDAKFAVENTNAEEPEAEPENAASAEAVEEPEAPKKTKKTTKAQ